MKYNFFVKFLAILLCAASLMGIAGGAAGALVLAEGDLYNRTVDQMIEENLRLDAAVFAEQTALAYAGKALGSCPEEMLQRYSTYFNCDYGYSILDADGNVLYELNPELKATAEVYSIPVTGQYMHLVSTETESQRLANEAAARMDAISGGMADSNGETIPVGGITINQVIFTNRENAPIYEASGDIHSGTSTFHYSDPNNVHSSSYDHGPLQQIGFLYYGSNGQLMYRSFLEENEAAFPSTEVCGVIFLSHESDFLFRAENAEGLGILTFENGYVCFTGYPDAEETVSEAIPETVPKTVPATVPETLPEETAAATTEATEETTSAETEAAEETEATGETAAEEEDTRPEDTEEKEASSASADPEEDNDAVLNEWLEDWDRLERMARNRIVTEWMVFLGLLDEEVLSDNTVPDVVLHHWLVECGLIAHNMSIPDIQDILEKTVPEETAAEETLPEEPVPAETLPEETVHLETVPDETVPVVTEPILIQGKPLETYQVNRTEYVDRETGEHTTARFVYLPLPELTVEVYADRSTMANAEFYSILRMVRQWRGALLPMTGICLLLFILSAVYLYTAAGRKPNILEVQAGGLNRLPLDLYLFLGTFAGIGLIALAGTGTPWLLRSDFTLGASLAIASVFLCCLIFTGFCFAFVAQAKTGNGFWWRNTLSARFIFLFMHWAEKFRIRMAETILPGLFRVVKKSWRKFRELLVRLYAAVEKITSRTGEKLNRFFSLIPMTWQWLIGGLVIILFSLLVNSHHILLILIGILVPIAIVLYATHCFGILSESAKRMSKGDLNTKAEDKLMVGCFQNFADDLNELADVATKAAQKQLKSERMKTELITNVSHDIKTPLTSIINYVDLLQKPHTEEETGQYLEVLDRQSQRLKKLVDDLMDMSKASTGNMTVEITRVDAVESVNQALGEFADKLDRAQLYPVFRHTEVSVPMMADGKLVWRILGNLLSNAVKYAMPGTRIYLDLSHVNGKVIISLKNISRKELNIDAEELMERFVRGDISRNTEGSGLGLNIAKSLMELQNGSLQLLVDGDLFKVTLIFPDAR